MKRSGFLMVVPVLLAVAGQAEARGNVFYDYAKVTGVEPVVRSYRKPVQERECWDEEVLREARVDSGEPTAIIAGGLIGAAIGRQFGKGHGRDVATVAGTLLGGAIGNDLSRSRPRPQSRAIEEVCRIRTSYVEEERITGYKVWYRYQGHEYQTRMRNEPGDRIKIKVKLQPVH